MGYLLYTICTVSTDDGGGQKSNAAYSEIEILVSSHHTEPNGSLPKHRIWCVCLAFEN